MHSSYSSTTQKTVEIRSSTATLDSEVAKLSDYIRRSVSKALNRLSQEPEKEREGTRTPATTTEASRYSRSVSESVYNDDSYFKPEFSDNEEGNEHHEDEEEHYKSFNVTSASAAAAVVCRKLDAPQEYGGWLGVTTLLLLVPSIVYYLQWCCTKSACNFKPPNLGALLNYKYLAKIFDYNALAGYISFNTGMFVLSAATFGRHVRLPNSIRPGQRFKFNALPIAVLITIAFVLAEYLKYPVADFVLKHYLRLCIFNIINALIVAFWAYCRAIYVNDDTVQVNIYGKSGNFLIDFALGRQINPKWFRFVDLKQVFYRSSLIATLIFAECFLYKNIKFPTLPLPTADVSIEGVSEQKLIIENFFSVIKYYYFNIQYDSAALLTALILLAYIVDAILFEHHLASSFELQGEGFGALLLLRYASSPFLYSAVAKYFFDRRVGIACCFAIYVTIIVFFSGLFLKRISSAIKYKYRIDPNNPYFTGIETIHTFQGRRLLLGAFWGRLRQPNYAGDILALCGLAVPLFLKFAWPPLVGIILCIVVLVQRAKRVNVRNTSRYHSSWVRYCNKVRYYVVPKIY